ncbi:MAG: T9SS type A sorting domain-containing protein, partial [Tunicatimonas sp.]|uniref:T9SS type A sorting domain-containing protein n=1 Tax=Tunicatimonas sp. TaxID=1940096 RepID=UPI003C707AFA
NPTSNWLTINWGARPTDITQVNIMDAQGLVYNTYLVNPKDANTTWKTDISGMPSGIYLAEIITKEEHQIIRFSVLR